MKNKISAIVCFLLISFVLSCQESKKEEATLKPDKDSRARRACNNGVLYKWLFPTDNYGYNANGCTTYFVNKGFSRQFKVQLSNTAGMQDLTLRIDHPDGTLLTYSVASTTGGVVTTVTPIPGSFTGSSYRWTCDDMPGSTTYELTLNVTASSSNGASENGLSLVLESPCQPAQDTDCDKDENLHIVKVD